MSKRIAIVGTRGAGKSVFITVLAKHLSQPRNGVQLVPDSLETAEYIELNYAALQRSEWIPSTNTDQALGWTFRSSGNKPQELTLLDFQGEVFQELFAKRDFEGDSLGEKDTELVDYLVGASSVIVLINLQDFLDASFEEDSVSGKLHREHALIEFLSTLKQDSNKHIAIVFTAYYQFRTRIKEEYNDVSNFLKLELPTFFCKHIEGSRTPGFLVSAVAETIKGSNGSVPKPGSKHVGLDKVISWMVDPAAYIKNFNKRKQTKNVREQQKEKDKNVDSPKWTEW